MDTSILLDLLCGCSSLDWDSLANLMGRVCMLMRADSADSERRDDAGAAAIMAQDVAAGEGESAAAGGISEDIESRVQDMMARESKANAIDIKKLLEGHSCQGFQISEGGDGRYGQFKTYVRITFKVTQYDPKTQAVKVTIRNAVGTRLASKSERTS